MKPKASPTIDDVPTAPWSVAIQLARHPIRDSDWYELGQELLPYLQPNENFVEGALRILADRVEWLSQQWEESKELLHAVARGDVDSRLREERDMWKQKFYEASASRDDDDDDSETSYRCSC
jgi:hypothetical protein